MKKIRGNIDYKSLWDKVNNNHEKEAPVAPTKEQEEPKEEPKAEEAAEKEPESPSNESTSSKIATQSDAIDYSNKIINFLEEKRKKFNKENNKRVPLAKFKKVFCSAASNSLMANYDINNWCVASINNFIDSKCDENFIQPSEKDVNFADFECKDYGLVFEFDLSDLFLQYKPEDYYFSP